MKHQLQPNTYTVCESPEQCKELFEWAKKNGIKTYYDCDMGETILSYYNNDSFGLVSERREIERSITKTMFYIPLSEFISRLKGNNTE